MSQTITITLPDETRNALDEAAGHDGLTESALIEKALTDYLFLRQFRSLRERMISNAKPRSDQDVFDLVS
jgi:predicted transcriptional regulator